MKFDIENAAGDGWVSWRVYDKSTGEEISRVTGLTLKRGQ